MAEVTDRDRELADQVLAGQMCPGNLRLNVILAVAQGREEGRQELRETLYTVAGDEHRYQGALKQALARARLAKGECDKNSARHAGGHLFEMITGIEKALGEEVQDV